MDCERNVSGNAAKIRQPSSAFATTKVVIAHVILLSCIASNAFAASFGGGVEVNLFHRLSWRPSQVEYLLTRFPETTTNRETQNNVRVSTGVVFHF